MCNNHLESRQRCLESAFSTLNEMSKLNWQQSKWIKLLPGHTLGSNCLPGGDPCTKDQEISNPQRSTAWTPTMGLRVTELGNQPAISLQLTVVHWLSCGEVLLKTQVFLHMCLPPEIGVSFKSFNHFPHQIEIRIVPSSVVTIYVFHSLQPRSQDLPSHWNGPQWSCISLGDGDGCCWCGKVISSNWFRLISLSYLAWKRGKLWQIVIVGK